MVAVALPICKPSKVLSAAFFQLYSDLTSPDYAEDHPQQLLIAYDDRIDVYVPILCGNELFVEKTYTILVESRISSLNVVSCCNGSQELLVVTANGLINFFKPRDKTDAKKADTTIYPGQKFLANQDLSQLLVAVGTKNMFVVYSSVGYLLLYASLKGKGSRAGKWTEIDNLFINAFFAKALCFDTESENVGIVCGGQAPKLLVCSLRPTKKGSYSFEIAFEVEVSFQPISIAYFDGQWRVYGETQVAICTKDSTPIEHDLHFGDASVRLSSAVQYQDGVLLQSGSLYFHDASGLHMLSGDGSSWRGHTIRLWDNIFFSYQQMESAIIEIDTASLTVAKLNCWQDSIAPILDFDVNVGSLGVMPSLLALSSDRLLKMQVTKGLRVHMQLEGLPSFSAGPWFPVENFMVFSLGERTVVMQLNQLTTQFTIRNNWANLDPSVPTLYIAKIGDRICQVTSYQVIDIMTGQRLIMLDNKDGPFIMASHHESHENILIGVTGMGCHLFNLDDGTSSTFNIDFQPSCIACDERIISVGSWTGDLLMMHYTDFDHHNVIRVSTCDSRIRSIVFSGMYIYIATTDVIRLSRDGRVLHTLPELVGLGASLAKGPKESLLAYSNKSTYIIDTNSQISVVLTGDTYQFSQPATSLWTEELSYGKILSPCNKVNAPIQVVSCGMQFETFGPECLAFVSDSQLTFASMELDEGLGVVGQHVLEGSPQLMYEHVEMLHPNFVVTTFLNRPAWFSYDKEEEPHSEGIQVLFLENLTEPVATKALDSTPTCLLSLEPWLPWTFAIGMANGIVSLLKFDYTAASGRQLIQLIDRSSSRHDCGPIVDLKVRPRNNENEIVVIICTETVVELALLERTSDGSMRWSNYQSHTYLSPTLCIGVSVKDVPGGFDVMVLNEFTGPEVIEVRGRIANAISSPLISKNMDFKGASPSVACKGGSYFVFGDESGKVVKCGMKDPIELFLSSRINQIRGVNPELLTEGELLPTGVKEIGLCCTSSGGIYSMFEILMPKSLQKELAADLWTTIDQGESSIKSLLQENGLLGDHLYNALLVASHNNDLGEQSKQILETLRQLRRISLLRPWSHDKINQ